MMWLKNIQQLTRFTPEITRFTVFGNGLCLISPKIGVYKAQNGLFHIQNGL